MAYNDKELKAKLKEWEYDEDSQIFTFALSDIKRYNILRAR